MPRWGERYWIDSWAGAADPQKKSRHRVLELPTFGERLALGVWLVRLETDYALFDFAVLAIKIKAG